MMPGTDPEQCPKIAVIIPTLNEADQICSVLKHVRSHGFCEVIVSDGGSCDGTPELAGKIHGVTVVGSSPGRGRQIATAVRASRAPILVILHADTRLPPGAAEMIANALQPSDVAGGCFRLRFSERNTMLALSAWFSRFESCLTSFGDQAFFMRRERLECAGGVPTTPILEDVELRRRLRQRGRFVKLEAAVVTSGRRLLRSGVVAGQLRNAGIFAANELGVPAETLARWYRPEPVYSRHRAQLDLV